MDESALGLASRRRLAAHDFLKMGFDGLRIFRNDIQSRFWWTTGLIRDDARDGFALKKIFSILRPPAMKCGEESQGG